MYLYLQLLCVFVILPNIALLFLNRKRIHLKSLGVALLMLFFIAVLWDQLSVRMGLWVFSQNEIVGNLFGKKKKKKILSKSKKVNKDE